MGNEPRKAGLQIKVPALPPQACSPNFRGHWSQKYKAAQEFKKLVYLCALEVKPKDWVAPDKVVLRLTFVTGDQRRRDADNLMAAAKPALDALTSAEIIKDDDSKHLTIGEVEIKSDKDSLPKTLIEIGEANDGK
jgi:Holliday junction resolvase RusA-like endonuclease